MPRRSQMDRWLDQQIVAAGRVTNRTTDPTMRAVWAARLVAFAQVRARVWKNDPEMEPETDGSG